MRRDLIKGISGGVMAVLGVLASAGMASAAAAVLPGFATQQVAAGMTNATAMTIAPDGRIFVSQQGGQLRLIKNGVLQAAPALTLTVDATNERGLLGTAFDPDFPAQPYIYIYYTVPNPTPNPNAPNQGAANRVSRFTVVGDTVNPASELVILQLPPLGTAPIHNSGAMHFAADKTLFISVGDNFNAPNSQNPASPMGKLLRINRDGTIPADNPFVGNPAYHQAVYAVGLRNPYTFAVQHSTGRILVNDVGDKLYDEINDIVPGGNYGWADTEGPHNDPRYLQPFVSLPWSPQICTVIGAAFYDATAFPVQYRGKFFYSDLCAAYIKVLDPATGQSETFSTGGLVTPVDLDVAPNGDLYYLSRGAGPGTGQVWRIFVSNGSPSIAMGPASQKVTIGDTATFTCVANGFQPLSFSWLYNGNLVQGPTVEEDSQSEYSFPVSAADNGASIVCRVSNYLGSADSAAAVLTATNNQAPNAFIITPAAGAQFRGGETLSFSGDASDPETQAQGPLPDSAFSWNVVFDRGTHANVVAMATGRTGQYLIPTVGEQSSNVKYRLVLRVTDPDGLVRTVTRDVLPLLSSLTIASSPSGREIKLDGQPKTAPITLASVAGMTRQVDVQTWQHLGEGGPTSEASTTWFTFQNWSDGGARAHTVTIPDDPSTLTANFNTLLNPACIEFPQLNRFLNTPFANQTGQFSMEFDATPLANTSPFINVTIGFSDGPRGGLPGQAGAIIFNNANRIQGRGFTGGEPSNALAPAYVVGQTYHFRLEVDLNTHMYDAYYTAPNQPEALLKSGLKFRAEHIFITQLNNWGVFNNIITADPSATVRVCNFKLNCSNAKNTPPEVNNLSVDKSQLWPPNHKMHDVTVNYTTTDNCGPVTTSLVVSSNEPGNNDWEIIDNHHVRLRAERKGNGNGRVYTITVIAVDGAGMASSSSVTVTVPHDQGH